MRWFELIRKHLTSLHLVALLNPFPATQHRFPCIVSAAAPKPPPLTHAASQPSPPLRAPPPSPSPSSLLQLPSSSLPLSPSQSPAPIPAAPPLSPLHSTSCARHRAMTKFAALSRPHVVPLVQKCQRQRLSFVCGPCQYSLLTTTPPPPPPPGPLHATSECQLSLLAQVHLLTALQTSRSIAISECRLRIQHRAWLWPSRCKV